MLLFSTILDINEKLTREALMELVTEWNRTSDYQENIIPGLKWNGEMPFSCGTGTVSLNAETYGDITAVRYRKTEENGTVWDTDYVVNHREGKMSVRLERSYLEEALQVSPVFSTPHFITLLIEHGYLKDDLDLPVSREPVILDENSLDKIVNVINGRKQYALPIVFVSKTYYDEDPLDTLLLASRLKGAAHVLVQKNVWSNNNLQRLSCGRNEYYGAVGIYYPNKQIPSRRLFPGTFEGSEKALLEKTVRTVIEYCSSQMIDPLYTWSGVSHALLREELNLRTEESIAAVHAREEAENEVNEVYGLFDRDIEKLKKKIEELTKENEALAMENQGLRAKMRSYDSIPVLYSGSEEDLYHNEVREIVLDCLKIQQKSLVPHTRRADVIEDLLNNNPSDGTIEEKTEILKRCLKDYKSLTSPLRQQLLELGFTITEEGKHYRLTYYGDSRYKTTIAKSGSDHREGRNIIQKIIGTML